MQPLHPHRQSFLARHLDPGDRLAEFLCGLIMVLTFTLGAGLTIADGPDAAISLLYAAIGCNFAWGIIDGVLFVLTAMSDRIQSASFAQTVHAAHDEVTARALIDAEVEERLGTLASPAARTALADDLLVRLRGDMGAAALDAQPRASRITGDDLRGALAIFWLEMLACVPAIIPFILLSNDHMLALRVSNGLLVAMLFVVGQQWGRYTGLNRWLVGLLMAGIGLALVVVALLLGG